jgi:hypothetical protein
MPSKSCALRRAKKPTNCNHGPDVLAISQPARAWISGQLLRAWAEPLGEPLLLGAEQHDIGWLDWETLRLDPAAVKKESSRVAFADALSLALCGDLKTPMTLEAPAQNGRSDPDRAYRSAGTAVRIRPRPMAFLG